MNEKGGNDIRRETLSNHRTSSVSLCSLSGTGAEALLGVYFWCRTTSRRKSVAIQFYSPPTQANNLLTISVHEAPIPSLRSKVPHIHQWCFVLVDKSYLSEFQRICLTRTVLETRTTSESLLISSRLPNMGIVWTLGKSKVRANTLLQYFSRLSPRSDSGRFVRA